jgi:ubiquinol-cytochrome c reductase iron-sulfur subunit
MAPTPEHNSSPSSATEAPVDSDLRRTIINTTAVFGVVGAACAALPFIKALGPNKAVKAAATLDVKLTDIPEGQAKTYLWQGKPVFVWHRTPEQIARAKEGDTTATMDPAKDADRAQKPEWLVVMGICTHLGCVPLQGGEFGGWRCPCHGSQYDDSGRVRHGPAGANLEVPPYKFLDDTTIRIG